MTRNRPTPISDGAMLALIGVAVALVGGGVAVGRPGGCAVRIRLAATPPGAADDGARAPAGATRRSGRRVAAGRAFALPGAVGVLRGVRAAGGARSSDWSPRRPVSASAPPCEGDRRARAGPRAASCARCTRPRGRAAWRSAAVAGGCCMPSSATRWWPSGRRSRASRPGWPCRRCSSGTDRRSPRRSRPTCSPARRRAGGRSATVYVFDPFGLSGGAGADVVAAAWGGHLGRCARGRLAAGRGRRARSAGRGGRRLLGDRRRAAPGAAPLHGSAHGCRHGSGRSLGLRAGIP